MPRDANRPKRRYHAPQRIAAAARTREAIVRAAKESFETRGWAATTMRAVGESAGVSLKTVEALFKTKAVLLHAAVDYAIRGDLDPRPMPERAPVRLMEQAPDAPTMLKLHAAHLREINGRSARIAWAVEQAAADDPAVAELWQQMNKNRAFAVHWATTTLLKKPGRKHALTRKDVETVFWNALDWATYRTLTEHAMLTPHQFERWLRRYYEAMLLT